MPRIHITPAEFWVIMRKKRQLYFLVVTVKGKGRSGQGRGWYSIKQKFL